jgi:hypothetical protein
LSGWNGKKAQGTAPFLFDVFLQPIYMGLSQHRKNSVSLRMDE